MKRIMILICLISFVLCGCNASGQLFKDPVTFYYIQEEYQYGENAGVIASEEREAAGHKDDLTYLMALYLMGPSEDGLISPIPRGTRILEVKNTGTVVKMRLSDTAATMSDANFTRACACMTLTLLDMTGAEKATFESGSRSITMSRDSLVLFDNSHLEEPK